METLEELESKNARRAGFIFKALTQSSDPACDFVAHKVVEPILDELEKEKLFTRKKALIEILVLIIQGSNILYTTRQPLSVSSKLIATKKEELLSPLFNQKDRLFECFISAIHSSNEYSLLRVAAVRGLEQLCMSSDLLSEIEVSSILFFLVEFFIVRIRFRFRFLKAS